MEKRKYKRRTVDNIKDGWELNNGPYEIYWKNGIARKINIQGVPFYFLPLQKY